MRTHEILLEALDLRRGDPHFGKRTESGIDAVHGRRSISTGDHGIDHRARSGHPGTRALAYGNLAGATRYLGENFEG